VLSIWAHLGQSNHPASQDYMLGFVVRFAIQNLLYSALVELLSIWPCKNICHIQVKLFTFFFQPHPIKPKLGLRWGEELQLTWTNQTMWPMNRRCWLCSATTRLNYAFTSLNELKLTFWLLIILNTWQHKNGPSLATHSK
jgi:hypothetical protein